MWHDVSADCLLPVRQTLRCTCSVNTTAVLFPGPCSCSCGHLDSKQRTWWFLDHPSPRAQGLWEVTLLSSPFFLSFVSVPPDFRVDMPILVEKFLHKLLFLWEKATGLVCCVCVIVGHSGNILDAVFFPRWTLRREAWVGRRWEETVSRSPALSSAA